jgi:NDP-sugar pyrophosphorylase family protein
LRDVYAPLVDAEGSRVRLFPSSGPFYDVGTPADYLTTALTVASAEGVPLDRGKGTVVAASARIDDSLLWDRVTIGDGAVLDHCIVADDVVVAPGARYHHAVITRDAVAPL